MYLKAACCIVELSNRSFLRCVKYARNLSNPSFRFSRALASRLDLATGELLNGREMQASEANIRLIFGRIARLRRVDRACDYRLIRLFANLAIVGLHETVTERANLINPFARVVRHYSVRGQDNGFRARFFSNYARGYLRGLASVRA